MNYREELIRLINLYVLKQNRTELIDAIDKYMAYRDKQLEYFISSAAGPLKTAWERIEA